ncbi:cytosine deaminase [Tranquillimonas rosea]|uniref:Cytosine deaminase n=1 Tax=Tranquillimonas rosea TaxID=641238 RepID=A0A1H9WJW1_9RHOB|nr:amidohydrolase family protein [Tranquillimonas rosea]SES34170.1 cytosine deaminase [Tranquillimonas rosea]
MDTIIRNAVTDPRTGRVDIGIRDGRIAALAPGLEADAGTAIHDAGGGFAFAGFVETHVHLDKACILDRAPAAADPAAAISGVRAAKRDFTAEDVQARAERVLDMMIAQGTTLLRTHVEVDPVVGLAGLRGVQAAAASRAWGIETEICVFPQDGLTNLPGTEALLRQALAQGATVLGACPYTDSDPMAQLDILFAMAAEFDVDLDMHLDFDLDPDLSTLEAVIARTEAQGWQDRVTLGHVNRLSAVGPEALHPMFDRLAAAGIALTALPSTDLFLMGGEADKCMPRGVSPVHTGCTHGVCCSLATNNVLNPFTPFGDGSALRMAHLYAHVARIGDEDGLTTCFDMVSDGATRLMNRPPRPIEPGAPATLVILDATSPVDAVRRLTPPLLAFHHGHLTLTNPRPRLHPRGPESA